MSSKESYLYSSPIGALEIQWKEDKLYSISRVHSSAGSGERKHSSKNRRRTPEFILFLVSQLRDYFSGKEIKKWDVLLYPRGTVFQKKVWKYLRSIPYGSCCSYSQAAQAVGSPKAFRAVGSACGKNPWLIIVPCHRVVGRKGLGGFALGLKAKSRLLALESRQKKAQTS